VAHYLDRWIEKGELRCANSRTAVFTLIAIVISYNAVRQVFSNEGMDPGRMFEAYADFNNA